MISTNTNRELSKPIRILMVGPHRRPKRVFGGDVVSFELLIDCLKKRNDVLVNSVSTLRPKRNFLLRFISSFITLIKLLIQIPRHDIVVLFVQNNSFVQVLRVVSNLCRFFHKPLIVRKFGGISHLERDGGKKVTDKIAKRINQLLKNIVLYIPETLYATNEALKHNITTLWIPGYRHLPHNSNFKIKKSCQKFVYIGRVIPEKGIREIIATAPLLNDCVSIDIFGQLDNGMTKEEFNEAKNIQYRGSLSPEHVFETLNKYDAYVFPTYWGGEGHPGSLIEAFACGLPAVTTNQPYIYEIANEDNSVIVKIKDVKSLAEGINKLVTDPELFHRLSIQAKNKSYLFNVDFWQDVFVNCCKCIINKTAFPEYYSNIQEMEIQAINYGTK
jgi:glycosyltransferase involved in cell wall biosynthesis